MRGNFNEEKTCQYASVEKKQNWCTMCYFFMKICTHVDNSSMFVRKKSGFHKGTYELTSKLYSLHSPQDISEWSYLLFLARTIDSVTKLNSLVVERSELELHIQLRSISSLSSCPQTRELRVETRWATQTQNHFSHPSGCPRSILKAISVSHHYTCCSYSYISRFLLFREMPTINC